MSYSIAIKRTPLVRLFAILAGSAAGGNVALQQAPAQILRHTVADCFSSGSMGKGEDNVAARPCQARDKSLRDGLIHQREDY
jgi:hypothetical protein